MNTEWFYSSEPSQSHPQLYSSVAVVGWWRGAHIRIYYRSCSLLYLCGAAYAALMRVERPHTALCACCAWVVAFLFLTRMFIFTKRFPVAHTRNHDHPQLGFITPADGRVKSVS